MAVTLGRLEKSGRRASRRAETMAVNSARAGSSSCSMVRLVGVCKRRKAVQLFLPGTGFFDENGFGFFLKSFFDFVDFVPRQGGVV